MVPVPRILFKLIYDKKNKAGLVFLTVNNPYMRKNDFISKLFCRNYIGCTGPNFISAFNNIKKGYSYCCLVKDFLHKYTVDMLSLPMVQANLPLINTNGQILLGDGKFMHHILTKNYSLLNRSIFQKFFTDQNYLLRLGL